MATIEKKFTIKRQKDIPPAELYLMEFSVIRSTYRYFKAIVKHNPEFTIGGNNDAEIAVPTKALIPPIVIPTTTAAPDEIATINPPIRLSARSEKHMTRN